MPSYSKLRQMESHRVRIEYDTGAYIVGYLATVRPSTGPVQLVKLTSATMDGAGGTAMDDVPAEMWVCPNVLTGLNLEEGPSGREH